jgi:flagellin-like protein
VKQSPHADPRERGQVAVIAAVLLLLFILIAGGLVDVYRLQDTRAWAYRAAEAAALSGVAQGRDFSTIYIVGAPRLDPGVGSAGAQQTLDSEIARRGLADVTYRIEVSEWGGEEFPGFPPVPRADLWGAGSWAAREPSVGVYVEVAVPTFLLGLTQQSVVTIHAFAAAGIGTQ